MSRTKLMSVALVVAVIGGSIGWAAEAVDKLKDIKCPVSGQPVSEKAVKEYKGGKVYFCCENCPNAFEKDKAKFAVKANHQLVATKQTNQKACPISGQAAEEGPAVKVAGAEVKVCCDKCKAKVEGGDEAANLTLLFNDDAFKKSFEVKKEEKK